MLILEAQRQTYDIEFVQLNAINVEEVLQWTGGIYGKCRHAPFTLEIVVPNVYGNLKAKGSTVNNRNPQGVYSDDGQYWINCPPLDEDNPWTELHYRFYSVADD